MNHFKAFIPVGLIGGALLLPPHLSAADKREPGLLGNRYWGVGLTLEHFHSARLDDAFGGLDSVNLPVAPGLDAALSYGVSHLTGTGYSRNENFLSASAIAYNRDEYGKPYFSATLGHARASAALLGTKTDNNGGFGALGTGLEVAFGNATAVNYGLSYTHSFNHSGWNPTWRYSVQVNHRFTPKLTGVASMSYNQIRHAPDSLLYTVGVRVMF